ncbi:hypothetical protein PHYBOEH_002643 [Phytophthora boehmeriae]|uniref:Uncharacterized protein n=1 Tax=Phytophthora boehmeriae TaxID=109152 RepID=A0A8T1WQB7_9STRA|nr:hypothetical protein PHYBOEH_002643 [Phytophthora boehmeriae]
MESATATATARTRPGDEKLMELCANESVVRTPPPRNENATWNFVQMNMTLLPIARPLPVTVSHRFQEGAALVGVKPCTPTQKLHHRLRQQTSNISPRRHDLESNSGSVLRPATATSTLNRRGLPPTPRTSCGGKRKLPDTWHAPAAIDTSVPPPEVSAALRARSFSDDRSPIAPRGESGYLSDPAMNGRHTPTDHSPLHRSASLSSGCVAKGLYKGKRILQLQDEDRRLHPDDRITAPSPSKRSKQS